MRDHKSSNIDFSEDSFFFEDQCDSSKKHIWFKIFSLIRKICHIFMWSSIGNSCDKKNWSHFIILPLTGYEISGLENLPQGPALLVYYHGTFPIDYHCFVIRLYRLTGRFCYSVIDNLILLLPGRKITMFRVFGEGGNNKIDSLTCEVHFFFSKVLFWVMLLWKYTYSILFSFTSKNRMIS